MDQKSIIKDKKLDKILNKMFWVVLVLGPTVILVLIYYVYYM